MKISVVFVIICIFIPGVIVTAQLQINFYKSTCPNAESIVRKVVEKKFGNDRSITAALLRMHFHDCFVKGCDASILIDSTKKKSSEKDAGPNLKVRGYELIDEAKRQLEAACPQKVSCADIITLATRDSVALAGGPKYTVPTGRRDGLVSDPNLVNLPGPTLSVSQALQFFTAKKLSLGEMVTLLGAHTVGFAHCSFFQDRLSNFQGTGKPDSKMDPALVSNLTRICANQGSDPTAFLDQSTPESHFNFDNGFYKQILLKRGVLQIDQDLALDKSSGTIVSGLARNAIQFQQDFAKAMVKMGSIEVLVGKAGQIRKNCRVFNPN